MIRRQWTIGSKTILPWRQPCADNASAPAFNRRHFDRRCPVSRRISHTPARIVARAKRYQDRRYIARHHDIHAVVGNRKRMHLCASRCIGGTHAREFPVPTRDFTNPIAADLAFGRWIASAWVFATRDDPSNIEPL